MWEVKDGKTKTTHRVVLAVYSTLLARKNKKEYFMCTFAPSIFCFCFCLVCFPKTILYVGPFWPSSMLPKHTNEKKKLAGCSNRMSWDKELPRDPFYAASVKQTFNGRANFSNA